MARKSLVQELAEKYNNPDWYVDTAFEHMLADKRSGRAWVCGCGACRTARRKSAARVAAALGVSDGE